MLIWEDYFNDYDENANVKGFIQKKTIDLVDEDSELNIMVEKTPCLLFQEYDEETTEIAGFVCLKPVKEIKISKYLAKSLKEFINK